MPRQLKETQIIVRKRICLISKGWDLKGVSTVGASSGMDGKIRKRILKVI